MKERRTRLKILLDIMETLNRLGEANVSQLIVEVNISSDRLSRYLDRLLERGLAEKRVVGREVRYRLTRKGHDFLDELKRVVKVVEAFGIEI